MRNVRGLIGMPVVCGGRRFGRVLRAELADDLTRLEGIWVGAGLRGARFIPAERLELIGSVAIHADGPGARRRMRAQPPLRRAIASDGRRVGAVTGAEVDELSFRVTALEVSAGVWDDLVRRRRRVSRYTVNRRTGEVVIDPADYEREAFFDEERTDEGTFDGHADRRLGGDDLRGDELADGAEVEPAGEADRQLAGQQGGGNGEEAVSGAGHPSPAPGEAETLD